jgi:hypothetical protein
METVSERAKNAVEALERAVNVLGNGEDMRYIAEQMSLMHRTLVQSFTRGVVIPFIKRLADFHCAGYCDARDEAACKACEVMWEALKKEYGLEGNEEPYLPLI